MQRKKKNNWPFWTQPSFLHYMGNEVQIQISSSARCLGTGRSFTLFLRVPFLKPLHQNDYQRYYKRKMLRLNLLSKASFIGESSLSSSLFHTSDKQTAAIFQHCQGNILNKKTARTGDIVLIVKDTNTGMREMTTQLALYPLYI